MLWFPSLSDILDAWNNWKLYGDATSAMLIAASIFDWLPTVAAAFSLIWVLIRIYETQTVQWLLYGKNGWNVPKD